MADSHPTPEGQKPTPKFARRSDRVSLVVPIQVRGTDAQGTSFDERAQTLVISRFGALIILARALGAGQEITIRCLGTGSEAKFSVVGQVERRKEGNVYGVEMVDPDVNLWEIHFPPATETEMAAGRTLLECSRCHACEVAYLNIGDIEIFHKNQRISRPCEHCNDLTIWNEASLRKLLVEPPSLAIDPLSGQAVPPVPQRSEDERVDPRITLSIGGCVRTAEHGEDVVTTENVSEGGVSFKSRKRYVEGAMVGFAVPYMPGRANVFVQARITWSRNLESEGLTAYGLAYLHARRRARRVKPRTPIAIGFIGSGVRSTGTVVDLSMTGVLVRCSEDFEAGAPVRMGMELGHETIRMAASARRFIPGVGTAFEFTQMTHRDRSLLRRLILRIEKQWGY